MHLPPDEPCITMPFKRITLESLVPTLPFGKPVVAERDRVDVGTVVGNYRLVEVIGSGGSAVVFRAEHVLGGRTVAFKVAHPSCLDHPVEIERFLREAHVAATAAGPRTIATLDFGIAATGQPYLVMENLQGETLEERCARGPLTLREIMFVATELAAALSAVHRLGVVHRDVKPDNVFIERTPAAGPGAIKLLDFGVARHAAVGEVEASDASLVGAPAYMAPEQCRGQPDIDHRADQYAFGCVLWKLLFGHPPFDLDPGATILAQVSQVPVPPGPSRRDFPPALRAIATRCLAKRQADRYPDMAAVQQALGQVLQVSEPAAPRPRWRHQWIALGFILPIVAGLVVQSFVG